MTDIEEIPDSADDDILTRRYDDYITQQIQQREQTNYQRNRDRLQQDLLIAEALLEQLRHHIQDALTHLDD